MNNNQYNIEWNLRSTSVKPDFIKANLIKNLALEQYHLGPNIKAFLFPTSTYLVNNGFLDKNLNIILFVYMLGVPNNDTERKIKLWIKMRREIYKKINKDLIEKNLGEFAKSDIEIEDLIKKEIQIYRRYKRYGNLRDVYLVTISDTDLETRIAGYKCKIIKGTSIYKVDKIKN